MLRSLIILLLFFCEVSSHAACRFFEETTPGSRHEKGFFVESQDDSGQKRIIHWAHHTHAVNPADFEWPMRELPPNAVFLGRGDFVIAKNHPLRAACIDRGLDLPTTKDFEALKNCFIQNSKDPQKDELVKLAQFLRITDDFFIDQEVERRLEEGTFEFPTQNISTQDDYRAGIQNIFVARLNKYEFSSRHESYSRGVPVWPIHCVYHLVPNPLNHP